MRILVVQNDPKLSTHINDILRRDSFKIDVFADLREAADAVRMVKFYRLVILDVEALNNQSINLIKEIRALTPKTAILAFTSQNDLDSRITILDAGADDVMVKPFPLAEMAAHCRALMRRARGGIQEIALVAGNVTLKPDTYEVFVGRKPIHFTKREINLLTQLMRRFPRIVPKTHLLDSLFAFSDSASPNAVEAIVSRVRKRLLSSDATITIRTEHGIGYLLVRVAADKKIKPLRAMVMDESADTLQANRW